MVVLVSCLIILLTATGQILLKKGADSKLRNQYINGFVISGYIAFLFTILLSYNLMKIIPLKYFTVIMSSSYVVVMFGARLLLKETITRNKILGTALIAFGVFVFLLR